MTYKKERPCFIMRSYCYVQWAQVTNHKPRTKKLTYCHSFHPSTTAIPRGGPEMAFLIAFGWRAEPQKVMLPSPGKITKVTLNWQEQRTCLLDKYPDQISWIIYYHNDYCQLKRITSEKILNTLLKAAEMIKWKRWRFFSLKLLKLFWCLCSALEYPYNRHFRK